MDNNFLPALRTAGCAFAAHNKPLESMPTVLKQPALWGLEPDAGLEWFDNALVSLKEEGLFTGKKRGDMKLTRKGERVLSGIRKKQGRKLELIRKSIATAVEPESGKAEAALYDKRLSDLLGFLDEKKKSALVGAEAQTLEALFAIHGELLFQQDLEYFSGAICDLLDEMHSLVAQAIFGVENPDAPKQPDTAYLHWEKIAQGLSFGRLYARTRIGPQLLHLLRVNPKYYKLTMVDVSREDDDKRSLPALCEKYKSPCATTGGFFLCSEPGIEPPSRQGDPAGLVVTDGQVLNPPIFNRSALITDEKGMVYIDRVGLKGLTVKIGKMAFPLKKVDAAPQKGEIVAFTPLFGDFAHKDAELYLSLIGRKIVDVSTDAPRIPINGFVIAINHQEFGAFGDLKAGDDVEYMLPKVKGRGDVKSAMAAGPRLIRDGRLSVEIEAEAFDGYAPPSAFFPGAVVLDALAPRMAWGINKRFELIACAVDGRDLQHSVGMSLADLARFMKKLGCVDAMNFDGGSSKQMCVQGKILDSSGAKGASKRPVSTAILVTR